MKILFLTNGYPSKINPRRIVFLQRLVNELVDQGHQCVVISPVPVPKERNYSFDVELQKTKQNNEIKVFFPHYFCFYLTARLHFDPLKEFSVSNCLKSIKKVIKENNIHFDVVYSHFLGVSAECAVHIAEEYNKPCFAAAGESVFSFFDAPDGYRVYNYLNMLNGIIAVSSENKKLLLERGILSDERITVLPNGIDESFFFPRNKKESRQKMNFDQDDIIIAFVGALIERKGPYRLEKASSTLPVKVAYAGSGTQIPKAPNTIMCQPVTPDLMPFFLSSADLFCLPTLNEGCCNAIAEALACGLPVLSSNLPFNDDLLDDSCSIRFDPNSVEEIRKCIEVIMNDESKRRSMSKAAAEKGKSLSLARRAEKIANWIQQQCAEPSFR